MTEYAQQRWSQWLFLGGAAGGVLATGVGMTALAPLLPALLTDGDLELSTASPLAWLLGLTALAFAASIAAGAVLGDLLGHARVFLAGAALFALASLLGAVASNAAMLLPARLLQGLAAGLLVPQMIGYARAHLTGIERTLAYGLFGVAFVSGTMLGPAVGVRLAEPGWRWTFWVLVVAATAAAALAVPLLPRPAGQRVDPLALAVAVAAVPAALGIMLPVTAREVTDWPAWYVLPLVAGCLLFGTCCVLEVLRQGVRAGLGAPLVVLFALGGAAYLNTLQWYAQLAGGRSVTSVATTLLPAVVAAVIGAAVAVALSLSDSGRVVAAPAGVAVIGAGVVHQLLVSGSPGAPGLGTLAVDAGLHGFGLALVVTSVMRWDRADAPPSAPVLGFGALALATPVGLALAQTFTSPALADFDPAAAAPLDPLRDATTSVLWASIVLLAAAAAVALVAGLLPGGRGHSPGRQEIARDPQMPDAATSRPR